MTEPLRTLRFLLSRLERISADSHWTHRASGVCGALLRVTEKLENDVPISQPELKRLSDLGFYLLEKAAKEKIK